MVNNPLVSICIPTYNGARYLRECLDSILCQSFHDFEIVVVDDQSSDGTVGIVEEYIQRDKRIKLFCNEKNVGLVNNWNRCIEFSQGEWVKYVFQDDLIAPTCLERMLQARYDDVPFVVCARSFIYEENIDQKTRQWFEKVLTLRKLFPLKHVVSNVEFIEASVRNPKINVVGEPTTTLLKRNIFNQNFPLNFIPNECEESYKACALYWLQPAIKSKSQNASDFASR